MKKCIIIHDSFKGTMTSTEVCEIMSAAIKGHFPDCEVIAIPVADGGEGSVDAFLTALGGEKVWLEVKNPYFEPMQSFFGLIDSGKTDGVGQVKVQAEGVGREQEEGRAYPGHEQCRYQRDPEKLLLFREVDGQGP